MPRLCNLIAGGGALMLLVACQPATERQEPEFAQPGAVVQVAEGDLQWCDLISRRTTADDCDIAQRTFDKAETGTALIKWPKSIKRGERFTIRLEVGNAPPPAVADEENASVTGDGGEGDAEEGAAADAPTSPVRPQTPRDDAETVSEPVPEATTPYSPLVGRFMSAQLTGAGFAITPSTAVSKELPPNSQIDWEWEVVAKHDGLQTLVVTTVVEFEDASGTRIPLQVTQKDQDFDVKVGLLGSIEDFLIGLPEWLKRVTAVLVALTGTVGAYFGLRRVLKNRGEGKA